jgi:ADP-ribose pyrophosphatase YjhB (NUDIX family)
MPSPPAGEFRFCPYCGVPLEALLRGDRTRRVCPSCGFVAYRNPTVGVAVVLLRDGEILLGRRTGSHAGAWCIPCGHVEWDEDLRVAAVREFEEETGLRVELTGVAAVHSNFHNPDHQTVGVWFQGAVTGGELCAGDDLDAVRFYPLDAPPEPLAFPTDRLVIEDLRQRHAAPGSA